MKLMFISDIHGSFFYTNKAFKIFEEEKFDYLILLGDILYHGPRNPLPKEYEPKKVAEILNKFKDKIIAIRGNCDSEVDQMILDFPILSENSNILINNRRIFLNHGHSFDRENINFLNKGDIFAFGHIHLPVIEEKDGIIFFNPGSISLPKENNPNSYGIINENEIIIKTFDGEILKSRKI